MGMYGTEYERHYWYHVFVDMEIYRGCIVIAAARRILMVKILIFIVRIFSVCLIFLGIQIAYEEMLHNRVL